MSVSLEPKEIYHVLKRGKKAKSEKIIKKCQILNSAVDAYFQSCGLRPSLVKPIRQTSSVFKQPVTIHLNHNSKVKNNPKNDESQEKPEQIFWEKRLKSLNTSETEGSEFGTLIGGLSPVKERASSKSTLNTSDSVGYRHQELMTYQFISE